MNECSCSTVDHYTAGMMLSGVGDALGYKKGLWEFNKSGPAIHQVRHTKIISVKNLCIHILIFLQYGKFIVNV